jgi:spore maturation protein CgeB
LRITIFGLTLSSSWGNGHATPYRALIRALYRRGHDVTFFEKDVPYYAQRRDFTSCDYCNLELYSSWPDVRSRALMHARNSDVVIVASYCPDGSVIADELLWLARPLRVFYDLDTPITLNRLARGGVDYLRADQIPEFDLYLSFAGGAILEELEERWGARLAAPLYGCVDPDIYFRVPARPDYRCDLSYLGTYAPDRQPKLHELFLEPSRRMPERQFLLAGSLYPHEWSWGASVRKLEHVPPAEHPAFYSSSRATLNLTRREMAAAGWCPSGRFFEAAACGAPILTDWWEGLDSFFVPGEELSVVSDAASVMAALRGEDSALARMSLRARARTLDEHTGDVRAGQLLRYCDDARDYHARKPAVAVAPRQEAA